MCDEQVIKPITSFKCHQKRMLQSKLKALCKLSWSVNRWMSFSSDLNKIGQCDNFNGQLLYVIEGLIPLLSAFCHEMSLHLSGPNSVCSGLLDTQKLIVIKELGTKLSVCCYIDLDLLHILTYCPFSLGTLQPSGFDCIWTLNKS